AGDLGLDLRHRLPACRQASRLRPARRRLPRGLAAAAPVRVSQDGAVTPLVTAVMVTRNRTGLARRALECLAAQTWPRLELVVVDDGDEDYASLLAPFAARFAVRYLRRRREPGVLLGALRNVGLEAARGELIVQWDDDEWYDPARVAVQADAL